MYPSFLEAGYIAALLFKELQIAVLLWRSSVRSNLPPFPCIACGYFEHYRLWVVSSAYDWDFIQSTAQTYKPQTFLTSEDRMVCTVSASSAPFPCSRKEGKQLCEMLIISLWFLNRLDLRALSIFPFPFLLQFCYCIAAPISAKYGFWNVNHIMFSEMHMTP